jgi:hypothetical protein
MKMGSCLTIEPTVVQDDGLEHWVYQVQMPAIGEERDQPAYLTIKYCLWVALCGCKEALAWEA